MESTLLCIAKVLNDAQVEWALAGSLVLKAYGLVEVTNDIDLLVAKGHSEKAVKALESIGVLVKPPIKGEYCTKVFRQFNIEGVDVDLMSGFRIRHEAGIYEFPYDAMTVTHSEIVDGQTLYYSSLEDWYVAYSLMVGRNDKVERIEKYLYENGLKHSELLARALDQPLPQLTKEGIIKLLKKA